MSDTASVSFEVIGVERCRRGPIIAVARVAVAIDGIEIVVDGWTIRDRGDQIEVSVPTYRHPANGEWWPVLAMPIELQNEIGRAIGAELGVV